jgi:hypothetical protein
MRLAAALAATLTIAACGSSSASSTTVQAHTVSGAASCSADQRQDLMFSGYVTGHLECPTASARCVKAAGNLKSDIGMSAPISARVGETPVQIVVVFQIDPVAAGSFDAGSVGDEQTSSPTGVTLDGIGHWQTQAGGGTMSIDEVSPVGAAGKLDVTLVKAADRITLRGSWRCAGSPAEASPAAA